MDETVRDLNQCSGGEHPEIKLQNRKKVMIVPLPALNTVLATQNPSETDINS